jgi:hypothetical protein
MNGEVASMLRLLLNTFAAKNADNAAISRASVVHLIDDTPQHPAPRDLKKLYPKSVCTSLRDLCEL